MSDQDFRGVLGDVWTITASYSRSNPALEPLLNEIVTAIDGEESPTTDRLERRFASLLVAETERANEIRDRIESLQTSLSPIENTIEFLTNQLEVIRGIE